MNARIILVSARLRAAALLAGWCCTLLLSACGGGGGGSADAAAAAGTAASGATSADNSRRTGGGRVGSGGSTGSTGATGSTSPTGPTTGCAATTAAITAVATANRLSGVAPLAVFFDGSATTAPASARPFHDLQYTWAFGENAGVGVSNWTNGTINGSHNVASGPVAAHVFETAGTFQICLSVTNGTAMAQQPVTITVTDPAIRFAGASTLCFSSSGNFSDAPAGFCTTPATAITTASFDTVLASAGTGMRLLMRRGETFTASSGAGIGAVGPGLIGAYGTAGAAPVVRSALTPGAVLLNFSPSATDWRAEDLELACAGIAYCVQARDQVTLLRLNAHDGSIGFAVSGDGTVLQDSTFRNIGGTSAGYGLFAGVTTQYLAALGNLLDLGVVSGTTPTHALRSYYLRKGVISDNTLAHAGPSYHLIKVHAPSINGTWTGQYSEMNVISNNRLNGYTNPWMMVLGAQNSSYDERLRDIIVERNLFVQGTAGAAVALEVENGTTGFTVRNNLFDISSSGGVAVALAVSGVGPVGTGHQVQNNTVYSGSANPFVGVLVSAGFGTASVQNNLGYAPAATAPVMVQFGGTGAAPSFNTSDAQLLQSPLFAANTTGSPYRVPADFRPTSGSYAIAAATPVALYADLLGVARTGYDLGAITH